MLIFIVKNFRSLIFTIFYYLIVTMYCVVKIDNQKIHFQKYYDNKKFFLTFLII